MVLLAIGALAFFGMFDPERLFPECECEDCFIDYRLNETGWTRINCCLYSYRENGTNDCKQEMKEIYFRTYDEIRQERQNISE